MRYMLGVTTSKLWFLRLIAFAGHAPGLRLVAGYQLSRRQLRANFIAVAATLAAMGICYGYAGGRAAFIAWLVGHFAWSFALSSSLKINDDIT